VHPDFEDITEPTGDANLPDPSKPISMASRTGTGQRLAEGDHGDSRGPEEPADPSITAGGTGIRSGSNLNDDDSKSETEMPRSGANQPSHPDISQPVNVVEKQQ